MGNALAVLGAVVPCPGAMNRAAVSAVHSSGRCTAFVLQTNVMKSKYQGEGATHMVQPHNMDSDLAGLCGI